MGLLNSIKSEPASRLESGIAPTEPGLASQVLVKFEVGRTAGALAIGGLAWILAALLYLGNYPQPAQGFFFVGTSLISAVLGVAVGEHSGAQEAADKSQER